MAKEFLKVRSGVGIKPNTAPSDPDDGDFYYDSGTSQFQFRQNGAWSGLSSSPSNPIWVKYTLSHTAFQTAATSNNIELVSLAAKTMIHQVVIKQSTAFAGTSVTAYTISIGIATNLTKYSAAYNVFQAVSDTARSITQADDVESFTGATSIKINAISTGANLSASTAGSVDVWVLSSLLP